MELLESVVEREGRKTALRIESTKSERPAFSVGNNKDKLYFTLQKLRTYDCQVKGE